MWNGPGSHVFGLLEYAACIYVEMFLAVMSLVSQNVLHAFVWKCSWQSRFAQSECAAFICVQMSLAVMSLVSQNVLHAFVCICSWQSCLWLVRMCCIHLCGNVPGSHVFG